MKKSHNRIKSARKDIKRTLVLKPSNSKMIKSEINEFESVESVSYNSAMGNNTNTNTNTSDTNSLKTISIETSMLSKDLKFILKELRCITQKIKKDEYEEEKSLDWKFAAMVIDRLCMVLFYFATLISTCLILLTSKNFFKSSDLSSNL